PELPEFASVYSAKLSQTAILPNQSPSPRWHEALAVHRRICVLRRQNRPTEAETLRHRVFEPLINALRTEPDLDAPALQTALAQEERRVEDAALVAEFILPF